MRKFAFILLTTTMLSTSALAQTGTAKTTSALSAEINSQFPDNSSGQITPFVLRQVNQDQNASYINSVTADQTVSGGANVTSNNLGTLTGGTTIDCGLDPLQYFTNNGTQTLTAPSNDGSCIVLMTNGTGAGAITFSGFSVGSNTGDSLTTTGSNSFSISMWRINGIAGYTISAHQ